eukprot:1854668-Alexandrium_andersonii.AAC.1
MIFQDTKEDLPEACGSPLTLQESSPERSSDLLRRVAVRAAPDSPQDHRFAAGSGRRAQDRGDAL